MSIFENSINQQITDGTITCYELQFQQPLVTNFLAMLTNSSYETVDNYSLDSASYNTYGFYTPWKTLAFLNGIFSIDHQPSGQYYIPNASTLADVYSSLNTTTQTINVAPLVQTLDLTPQTQLNYSYLDLLVASSLAVPINI